MSLGITMDETDRLFTHGRPNPAKFGWPLRSSAGEPPDRRRLEKAAAMLGRPCTLVDADGYECEILGAAVNDNDDIAYVESRAKDVGSHVDISIRVHLMTKRGWHESIDIESYNPFFGCDVRFLEWIDATAVLIYREKHWTFACRFGDVWPPRFVKIEDDWVIDGNILGYVGYKETSVRRLSFPALDTLDSIPASEAAKIGLFPAVEERPMEAPSSGAPGKRSWRQWLFGRGLGR